MKINTALILCAGFGKRLNPLTLKTPKPLLKLNNTTVLESCINVIMKLGIEKIFLNTFHLSEQIFNFVKSKNFPIDIQIIKDGGEILNTGGGILNMSNHFQENDFLIFNPDTLWDEKYVEEINEMKNFYFLNDLNNILLVTNKKSYQSQTSIPWSECHGIDLCLISPENQFRRILNSIFLKKNISPNVLIESNSLIHLFSHVSSSSLSTIMPGSFAKQFNFNNEISFLELTSPSIFHHVGGVYIKDKGPSPIKDRFIKYLNSIDK